MAFGLKYYSDYVDVKNVEHRIEIYEPDFVGTSTEIKASCILEYGQTDDTLESVRGSGLRIDIDASTDLTLSDLYTENERTFRVTYKRDSIISFDGWLTPDNLFESFVTDKWVLSLDCVDGIGFLSNLSYVNDSNGLPFTGKQSLLEIITNCLKRTRIEQDILINIDLVYKGLSESLDISKNVFFNVNRFIKDDNETIMNCMEVLKSVLEPFGAVLSNYKGKWVVFKPNTLVSTQNITLFSYDSDGVANSPTTETIDFSFNLGSDVNGAYPHHVNANQQKTIKSSLGAYRINYKYGLVKSLLDNKFLISENGTTIDNWTLVSANTEIRPSNSGVIIDIKDPQTLAMTSEVVSFAIGDVTKLSLGFKTYGDAVNFQTRVILWNGAVDYYLQNDGSWTLTDTMVTYFEGVPNPDKAPGEPNFIGSESLAIREITTEGMPDTGDLYIEIWTPLNDGETSSTAGEVEFLQIDFTPEETGNVEGENHTFQRIANPSTKIIETKEIFNADNPSDIYLGTIYENDETTPTFKWNRKGITEEKFLLQIMGEERMKMYAKPLQVFSGDVYGYFDYLSAVSISGLNGLFMPLAYTYDTLNNVITHQLVQVLDDDILTDLSYEITFDYGEVVEPTIIG